LVDEASEPLLASNKQRLPELEKLLKQVSAHCKPPLPSKTDSARPSHGEHAPEEFTPFEM